MYFFMLYNSQVKNRFYVEVIVAVALSGDEATVAQRSCAAPLVPPECLCYVHPQRHSPGSYDGEVHG